MLREKFQQRHACKSWDIIQSWSILEIRLDKEPIPSEWHGFCNQAFTHLVCTRTHAATLGLHANTNSPILYPTLTSNMLLISTLYCTFCAKIRGLSHWHWPEFHLDSPWFLCHITYVTTSIIMKHMSKATAIPTIVKRNRTTTADNFPNLH